MSYPVDWHSLVSLERDILIALRRMDCGDVDQTGANIQQACNSLGARSAASVVYPKLHALESEGLIEKTQCSGDKADNQWSLTDDGEELLAAYVSSFETFYQDGEQ